MRQQTLADEGFERYRNPMRRDQFLAEMDQVIPWRDWCNVVKPFYPTPKGAGRPPVGLERMLRLHFLQHWFNLSDPAVEEALYDSRAMRRFVGIDLEHEPAPDEITVCKFHHLLEEHNLGDLLFVLINAHLQENGLKVSTGTIIDALSSTKNKDGERDPEMHQTRKGNQWYFGVKAHISVDSQTKLIHSIAANAANVHDNQLPGDLLHGEETRVWGDSAYTGQGDVIREHAPKAQDFTYQKEFRNHPLSDEDAARNRTKSRVRAKVGHPFLALKRIFGFNKVRYRGFDKNVTGCLWLPGWSICRRHDGSCCDLRRMRTSASYH
jgi:IS5 family transposase